MRRSCKAPNTLSEADEDDSLSLQRLLWIAGNIWGAVGPLAIISPFRWYIPLARGFFDRWGVRLAILELVAFQWIPLAGAFTLPAMALINYLAYRSAYRGLALSPCAETVTATAAGRVFGQPSELSVESR